MLNALFLTAIFIAYILLKLFLGKHLHRHYIPTDEDLLCALALERGCSGYDIFRAAGKEWGYSDSRIDDDFHIYLNTADIPLYVRQHLRNQPPSWNPICQDRPPLPF